MGVGMNPVSPCRTVGTPNVLTRKEPMDGPINMGMATLKTIRIPSNFPLLLSGSRFLIHAPVDRV